MRPLKKAINNVIKKNPVTEIRDGSTSPEVKYDDIIEALSKRKSKFQTEKQNLSSK